MPHQIRAKTPIPDWHRNLFEFEWETGDQFYEGVCRIHRSKDDIYPPKVDFDSLFSVDEDGIKTPCSAPAELIEWLIYEEER